MKSGFVNFGEIIHILYVLFFFILILKPHVLLNISKNSPNYYCTTTFTQSQESIFINTTYQLVY